MRRVASSTQSINNTLEADLAEVEIAGLRQFIKKNKAIPEFFAAVETNHVIHQIWLSQLKDAITQGDMSHAIFSHVNCMPYLLYLIEKKLLPFWQGITAYHYLVAIAQFTKKQALKPEDNVEQLSVFNVKNIRRAEMVRLIDPDRMKLSDEGIMYLTHVCYQFKRIHIDITLDEIEAFLLTQTVIEQQVLKVSNYEANFRHYEVDMFLKKIRENVPFFRDINSNLFNLPSTSLIKFFLRKMSDHPVEMMPVFGKISLETLHQLHLLNKHPVILYSLLVKDTLIDVHNYHCGPFVVMVHDIGHCFWGTLLGKANRDLINKELIPLCQNAKRRFGLEDNQTIFDTICRHLTDYDLTPLPNYADPSTRFTIYITHCIKVTIEAHRLRADHAGHDAVLLSTLREYVIDKNFANREQPCWLAICEGIDRDYKAILQPLKSEDNDSALDLAPTREVSSASSAEASTKKIKLSSADNNQ